MSELPTEYADLPDIKIAYTQYGSGQILLLRGSYRYPNDVSY